MNGGKCITHDDLICLVCSEYCVDPVQLPCKSYLCKRHITGNDFKCEKCEIVHTEPFLSDFDCKELFKQICQHMAMMKRQFMESATDQSQFKPLDIISAYLNRMATEQDFDNSKLSALDYDLDNYQPHDSIVVSSKHFVEKSELSYKRNRNRNVESSKSQTQDIKYSDSHIS